MKHVLAAGLAMLVLAGCGISNPDVSQAKPYKVISTEDFSFPGRKRVQVNVISPDAASREQFAHTAIKAARDMQGGNQAQVVWVRLQVTAALSSTLYAEARYAPDGGGLSGDDAWAWKVMAAQAPQHLSELPADAYLVLEDYTVKGS